MNGIIGIKTDGATYELIQTTKAQQEFVLESHAHVREQLPGEILGELQKCGDSSEIEEGVHKFVEWIKSGKRKGEMLELYQKPLTEVPIKRVSVGAQRPFVDKVDRILAAKQRNAEADTSALEWEIDELVYALYGLTPDEIAIVEGSRKS